VSHTRRWMRHAGEPVGGPHALAVSAAGKTVTGAPSGSVSVPKPWSRIGASIGSNTMSSGFRGDAPKKTPNIRRNGPIDSLKNSNNWSQAILNTDKTAEKLPFPSAFSARVRSIGSLCGFGKSGSPVGPQSTDSPQRRPRRAALETCADDFAVPLLSFISSGDYSTTSSPRITRQ
jgi:hypothetical protein